MKPNRAKQPALSDLFPNVAEDGLLKTMDAWLAAVHGENKEAVFCGFGRICLYKLLCVKVIHICYATTDPGRKLRLPKQAPPKLHRRNFFAAMPRDAGSACRISPRPPTQPCGKLALPA
jgi:hypothetical protein